jgi:opacity protein-like surface antigen
MKKVILSIALVAAAAASQAQVYVQGNLGSANASAQGGNSLSSSSLGAGVGYQVNANFAVDALYQKLYKEPGVTSNAISVRAIGIYPLSDKVSFNGKLGLGSTKLKDTGDSASGSLTYGVGMDFAVSKQVSLGLDIDFYKTKETAALYAVKQTNVSIGIKYRF